MSTKSELEMKWDWVKKKLRIEMTFTLCRENVVCRLWWGLFHEIQFNLYDKQMVSASTNGKKASVDRWQLCFMQDIFPVKLKLEGLTIVISCSPLELVDITDMKKKQGICYKRKEETENKWLKLWK